MTMTINKEHKVMLPIIIKNYIQEVAPKLQVVFIEDKDYDVIGSIETDILWVGVIKIDIPRLEKPIITVLNGETNMISVLDYNGKRVIELYGFSC